MALHKSMPTASPPASSLASSPHETSSLTSLPSPSSSSSTHPQSLPFPPARSPASQLRNKIGQINSRPQIFLGGSCNPTTWRQQIAIPFLEQRGITYYNPQVDDWTPEVVEIERRAKQSADLLFFVIDKQTRSTVGLVESAFLAGDNKNLVLVICPFEYDLLSLSDTQEKTSSITQKMSLLMKTANRTLSQEGSFVRSSKSTKSSSASYSAARSAHLAPTLKSSIANHRSESSSSSSTTSVSQISSTTAAAAVSGGNCSSSLLSTVESVAATPEQVDTLGGYAGAMGRISSRLDAMQREKRQLGGLARVNGEDISLKELQELARARFILQSLVALERIPMFSDILQALNYISKRLHGDAEQTNMTAHHIRPKQNEQQQHGLGLNASMTDFPPLSRAEMKQGSPCDTSGAVSMKDVYLTVNGGEGDDENDACQLIESSVISKLEEEGLTYNCLTVSKVIDPQINNRLCQNSDLAESSIDNCSVTPPAIEQHQQQRHLMSNVTTPASPLSSSEPLANAPVSPSSVPVVSIAKQTRTTALSDSRPSVDLTKSTIERELCTIRRSRVLLFVITNKCRGLSIMVLASHFMALFRKNVVLCVQYLDEPCSIGGETLTKNAIADYNRGRVYLCDYAVKSKVPVFSTIQEAIECCSRKCRCPSPSGSDLITSTNNSNDNLLTMPDDNKFSPSPISSGGNSDHIEQQQLQQQQQLDDLNALGPAASERY